MWFIKFSGTIIDEVTSIRGAGKDLFCILNEFAALEEEMRQRITVFKEFMLQEDNCGEIEMLDKMEYIVVAEILEDSDFEICRREAFIDNSSLPDDILNSLYETSLKTVELQTSKESSSIHCESHLPEEEFLMPAFDSMSEVTATSDDEKDELVIVEDDHVDDNSVSGKLIFFYI